MSDPSDNPPNLLQRLKERKLVQWALAYIAGGWVVLQVLDVTAEPWGLSNGVVRVAQAALVVGFIVMLVLAWYHGEQGRQRVSGPELLIIAGLLIVAGIGFQVLVSDDGASEEQAITTTIPVPEASIAVLPFDDLSPEGDQQYFVEGLSEEIINALAQIPDLKVSARTSTFLLAEQGTDIATVARTLGVANVLEGSVRKSGDQIRITAQLIEAETEFHLWSETFDRELTEIFTIQDEIARAITDQLQVTLAGDQQTQLVARGTQSTEAHEAYLRGRYLMEQRTGDSLRNAIIEFGRAVRLDPDYGEAYSGLADSHLLVDEYASSGEERDYRANLELGLQAARTAVSLAPQRGIVHASLGWALFMTGEWEGAERELRRAIELSPTFATAHQWLSVLLYSTGRGEESLAPAERAIELDPVSRIVSRIMGIALFFSGQLSEATDQVRRTIDLAPSWPSVWFDLSARLFLLGDYENGLEAFVTSARLANLDVPSVTDAYQAAVRYRETGEPQTFSDVDMNPYDLSWLYAETGQLDLAIDVLEEYFFRTGSYGRAAQAHVWFGANLLGDDPRYQALLEEAGITW